MYDLFLNIKNFESGVKDQVCNQIRGKRDYRIKNKDDEVIVL